MSTGFRRLVVAMGHGEAGPATLRRAADMARQLHLELHCLLVEDEALFGLADFAFARELRLPTHDWQPFEAARLADEFAHLAAELRRTLAGLAASAGTAPALQVRRGDPAACLGGICGEGDIVLVAEPAALPLSDAVRAAALRLPAPVMLLPRSMPTRAAPLAAVATGPDDPGLPAALRIAAATGEDVVLVAHEATADAVAQAAVRLAPGQRLTLRAIPATAGLLDALRPGVPRLVVLGRPAFTPEAASALARREGVAVLLAG